MTMESNEQNELMDFNPSRVILLSELSTREKENYYTILLTNKVKFRKNSNNPGLYVADVRLLSPALKKSDYNRDLNNNSSYPDFSWGRENRLKQLVEVGHVTVKISGVEPFNYNAYTKFSVLIANNNDTVTPKIKTISWLMKSIEDIYDARYIQEKLDVENEERQIRLSSSTKSVNSSGRDMSNSVFPFYVIKRLATFVGTLSKILDQNCWDLLYNICRFRNEYIEVEVFSRFLSELYSKDDLLFYLYVRNILSNLLHINFKLRWAKSDVGKVLWISFRECVFIARAIFGPDNESAFRNFMNVLIPQMVGQKSHKNDSRRIDIGQFLHLAVVGYHQSQYPDGGISETSEDVLPNDDIDYNEFEEESNDFYDPSLLVRTDDKYLQADRLLFRKAYEESLKRSSSPIASKKFVNEFSPSNDIADDTISHSNSKSSVNSRNNSLPYSNHSTSSGSNGNSKTLSDSELQGKVDEILGLGHINNNSVLASIMNEERMDNELGE